MSQGTLEGRQNAQNGSVAVPLLLMEATRPKVSVNDDDADLGLGESSSENSLSVPCQSGVRVRTTLDLSMPNVTLLVDPIFLFSSPFQFQVILKLMSGDKGVLADGFFLIFFTHYPFTTTWQM